MKELLLVWFLLYVFIGAYWILLWRDLVPWNLRRVALTAVASVLSLAGGFVVAVVFLLFNTFRRAEGRAPFSLDDLVGRIATVAVAIPAGRLVRVYVRAEGQTHGPVRRPWLVAGARPRGGGRQPQRRPQRGLRDQAERRGGQFLLGQRRRGGT